MDSIKDKIFNYLDCIEKMLARIDSDVNNVISAGWYSYFNEYSDKELVILEDIAEDLCLLSFQNIILNLCNLYKDNSDSISLYKVINYLEVNYKSLNLDKNIVLSFCDTQREYLHKIKKKDIHRDIFDARDKQIAHVDKNMIASFEKFREESIYYISLKSLLINLINPAKKIVRDVFALFGIEKNYNRKYDNRFKTIYKKITKI